ncbi:hypothetical protein Pth03_46820 [Planotetraspora thailandica]|uniref:Uncharacterized protein n=1 Tax=Planotetraspora thailandica TaxID=487172 RepID=A0A8J3V2K3_9ACTN|nr:hypothetical protein [Planotetraspora thailandica]GII56293.1 hypothetical protein Pth03_46820 [Planotetraspora thailandica]
MALGRQRGRKARRYVMGWSLFSTGGFLWNLLGDYLISGRQELTLVQIAGRAAGAGVVWALGVTLIVWAARRAGDG